MDVSNPIRNPPTRKINLFSDVYKMLKDKQKKHVDLVNSIFDLNEENLENVLKMINESGEDAKSLMSVVEYALFIRPLKRECLVSLYCKLAQKYGCTIFDVSSELERILILKGVLKNDYITPIYSSLDELINITVDGSIERIIMHDDVDAFIKVAASPNFNPTALINNNSIPTKVFNFVNGSNMVSLPQIMALFGSIKCFKYSMMSGCYDFSNIAKFAIAGGNNEIIHLLENAGTSFDFCYEVAIKYNRNDIADWLLNNYKCETVSKVSCDVFHNDVARIFMELNGINVPPHNEVISLYQAVESNDIETVRFLIEENHMNPNATDPVGWSLMHMVSRDELDVPRYLFEKCHVKANNFEPTGLRTPLHFASENNLIKFTRYLVEVCGADPKQGDRYQMLPIHYAAKYLSPQIIEYFVKECGVDVNAKNIGNFTPLHFAFKQGPEAGIALIKLGASVNVRGEDGVTPLQMAKRHGYYNDIKDLIKRV